MVARGYCEFCRCVPSACVCPCRARLYVYTPCMYIDAMMLLFTDRRRLFRGLFFQRPSSAVRGGGAASCRKFWGRFVEWFAGRRLVGFCAVAVGIVRGLFTMSAF